MSLNAIRVARNLFQIRDRKSKLLVEGYENTVLTGQKDISNSLVHKLGISEPETPGLTPVSVKESFGFYNFSTSLVLAQEYTTFMHW